MQKGLWTRLALLGLLTTLGGCAKDTLEIGPGTRTDSVNSAACISLARISPNRGKPGVTTEDISAALDRDSPIGRVRNVVGDNASTLIQIDKNNAALDSLCGAGGG